MRMGIVVPAWNAVPWVGDAITSVIAQSHRDWTLVVVDDGSTDGTADVVRGFSDPRIGLVRQANAGVAAARNRGIAELSGTVDTLLCLDADDRLAPDALSRLAAALDAVAASGACAFVGHGGTLRPPSGDVLERLLVRNRFANGGHLLIRRTAVQAAGGFRPGLAYGEDWEFFVRVALLGRFATVAGLAPVLFVHHHAGGAYQRLACDPSAFVPCMDAIFGSPRLLARFSPQSLAAIRRRTDAENHWIIGRELIRHDRRAEGRAWLRRSVRTNPAPKRLALLGVAAVLPLLPSALRGPFRRYRLPPRSALRSPATEDVHRPGDRPGLPRNA